MKFNIIVLLPTICVFAFISSMSVASACFITLEPDDTGPSVKCLQQLLTVTRDYNGQVLTEVYDTKTTEAVQRFQARTGIVSSGTIAETGFGRYGKHTQQALAAESLNLLQQQLAQMVNYPSADGATLNSEYISVITKLTDEEALTQSTNVTRNFVYNNQNNTIDLRKYFPATTTNVIKRKANGSVYSSHNYKPASASFQTLYNNLMNQGKPGQVYTLQKRYGSESPTCTATYAILFMGDDRSVTEVGDWLATDKCTLDTAFGYYNSARTTPSGLMWSAPGGLRTKDSLRSDWPLPSKIEDLKIYRQNFKGDTYTYRNNSTWNETEVVETLGTYKPPYGRDADGVWGAGKGKTYNDVIRIRLYHGTRSGPNPTPVNCSSSIVNNNNSFTGGYKHNPKYRSYTSEYYLAPSKGIIQETLLYVEDGRYWASANCKMGIMFNRDQGADSVWTSYIDER